MRRVSSGGQEKLFTREENLFADSGEPLTSEQTLVTREETLLARGRKSLTREQESLTREQKWLVADAKLVTTLRRNGHARLVSARTRRQDAVAPPRTTSP